MKLQNFTEFVNEGIKPSVIENSYPVIYGTVKSGPYKPGYIFNLKSNEFEPLTGQRGGTYRFTDREKDFKVDSDLNLDTFTKDKKWDDFNLKRIFSRFNPAIKKLVIYKKSNGELSHTIEEL